jgi:CheY-like chemotaxis protein
MADETDQTFRVLVVDDEESVRGFVERVLTRPGYHPAVAGGGAEALTVYDTAGPFDLLVTDLAMPGIAGDELARRLRQSQPDLKILYLTGYSDRLFDERTLLWEDEAFLDKPVTVQGLLEAISLLLVGRVPSPRPVRVPVPGARIRFANTVANLETLSLTGALVQTAERVAVESVWPVILELPSETVRMTGRVVSCEPREGSAPPSYAVAIAFVQPSASATLALERVCREHQATA